MACLKMILLKHPFYFQNSSKDYNSNSLNKSVEMTQVYSDQVERIAKMHPNKYNHSFNV